MTQQTEATGFEGRKRIRPFLRFGLAGLLLGPGASKLITFETSVRFFESLGLPWPSVLVPVVGALELGAAGSLLLDRYPRVAALVTIPILGVAAFVAGPTWQNVGGITVAIASIAVDTSEVRRL